MPNPSYPESRASTAWVDLDAFVSEESGSSNVCSWTSMFERDWGSVSSGNSRVDEQSDMSFPDCPVSPIPDIDSPIMVESPSHYGAPDVPVDVPALLDTVACMSQVSAFSSVLLSPNRVREDCTSMTADVFPIYQVSPDTTGYQPATSPVTPPIPKPPGATGSFDSLIGLDLLDQETDFSCLSAPLLAFPDDLFRFQIRDQRRLCISHHGGRLPQSSLFRGNSPEKDLLTCTARCLTQGVIR